MSVTFDAHSHTLMEARSTHTHTILRASDAHSLLSVPFYVGYASVSAQ